MGLILPGPGRDKMATIIFRSNSVVVKHLPYRPKSMGLILATSSETGREKMAKITFRGRSARVEHLPHHPKVMGLILATASGIGREKNGKNNIQMQ